MKKIIYITLLCLLYFPLSVNAKENYYTNKKGVSFTKEEYNFISQAYWDGAQDMMSLNDYERYINSRILDGEIETKKMSTITPFNVTLNKVDRNFKITKSCADDCIIILTANWNQIPTIKSYDVIGARFDSTSLIRYSSTTVIDATNKTSSYSNYKTSTNGIGNSVNLSGFRNNIKVVMQFTVSKSGKVIATYQHATRAISLNNSKQYTISQNGYGSVFLFSGTAHSTYDNYGSVDISV